MSVKENEVLLRKQKCLKTVLRVVLGLLILPLTILEINWIARKILTHKRHRDLDDVGSWSPPLAQQKTHASLTEDRECIQRNNEYDFGSRYPFNCTNIHKIRIIKRNTGSGLSRSVDIGLVNGQKVVIKKLSPTKNHFPWTGFRDLLFLKDTLMTDQLKHPSIIKMLGFCFRHLSHESSSSYPRKADISVVYEYGEHFNLSLLVLSPFERVKHAIELSDLLNYLHSSPIGSLSIGDFKDDEHFLMVNGKIKIIDLDRLNDVQKSCKPNSTKEDEKCPFNISCKKLITSQIDLNLCDNVTACDFGICPGSAALENIDLISDAFLQNLLNPDFFPEKLKYKINALFNLIHIHSLYPAQLLNRVKILQKLLKVSE